VARRIGGVGDGCSGGAGGADMSLPTPRTSLAAHCSVTAMCKHCSNRATLDLETLIRAGHGDKPLLELPLRCSRCREFGHQVVVSGRSFAGLDAKVDRTT
jgi:hypothetical protein